MRVLIRYFKDSEGRFHFPYLENPVPINNGPILAALVHQYIALQILVKTHLSVELRQHRSVSVCCTTHCIKCLHHCMIHKARYQ